MKTMFEMIPKETAMKRKTDEDGNENFLRTARQGYLDLKSLEDFNSIIGGELR